MHHKCPALSFVQKDRVIIRGAELKGVWQVKFHPLHVLWRLVGKCNYDFENWLLCSRFILLRHAWQAVLKEIGQIIHWPIPQLIFFIIQIYIKGDPCKGVVYLTLFFFANIAIPCSLLWGCCLLYAWIEQVWHTLSIPTKPVVLSHLFICLPSFT